MHVRHRRHVCEPLPATIGACSALARERLAAPDAQALLCDALAVATSDLFAFPERAVPAARAAQLVEWVERRLAGEPVAYILGRRGFWSLDLEVTPAALIPRPDSEALVAAALPYIGAGSRVHDLGTGCGNLALAIATERPQAQVLATDVDPRCTALARRNAERLALTIETRVADRFAGLGDGFDVILSNPPYVASDDPHLQQGDLRFEPQLALVGGRHGLGFLEGIVQEAPARLRPGGWLCVEHGCDQHEAVAAMFRQAGFEQVQMRRDLGNRPRVTLGTTAAAP